MSASQELLTAEPFQPAKSAFDVHSVRKDFPILHQLINGKPLVYFDNAATTQKPQIVIDAIHTYYSAQNANIHRGVHYLSEKATELYEQSRFDIRLFLNAPEMREVIFTRGTTESINLVAQTYGRQHVNAGDEVIISGLEHHSNIVPWQILCEEKHAVLRIIPINDNGDIMLEEFEKILSSKTKIVSVNHVSNALGTVNPVKKIIELAHQMDVPVLVDGAQAAPHIPIDVQDLGCDFYAISGHKMYGPTGVGVLYGKAALLDEMPPYQGGGDMIKSVAFEKTTYNDLPYKFEAGTPHIAGGIGLGAAVRYLRNIGLPAITAYEDQLLTYATAQLSEFDGLKLIGTAREKAGVVSFIIKDVHPHDIGTIINNEGIAIRTGHHCAQPVMRRFDVPATARLSLALYNTRDEIDKLTRALHKVYEVFR